MDALCISSYCSLAQSEDRLYFPKNIKKWICLVGDGEQEKKKIAHKYEFVAAISSLYGP